MNLLAFLFLCLLYLGTSHIRDYVTDGSYSVLKACIFLSVKAFVTQRHDLYYLANEFAVLSQGMLGAVLGKLVTVMALRQMEDSLLSTSRLSRRNIIPVVLEECPSHSHSLNQSQRGLERCLSM